MDLIDSYEKFCLAFKGDTDDVRNAELLLLLQDWIIRMRGRIDKAGVDCGLDELLAGNTDKSYLHFAKKDAASRIVDESYDAIRRIADNLREKIVRENVKMPAYKVREVNSYGMNWLSRKPGSTIKEKISGSNSSMMAVRRRMSYDTGENRLFIAFLRELSEVLETKIKYFPESQLDGEEDIISQLLSVIRDPENEEIRRWENMPPNNTLLSDRNYSVIWRCWNELKIIDSLIADDSKNLDVRICMMFFIEFLTNSSHVFLLPQIPVDVDYWAYSVKLYSTEFWGLDPEGNVLEIEKNEKSIELFYQGKKERIDFSDGCIRIDVNEDEDYSAPFGISSMNRYVDLAISKLCGKIKEKNGPNTGTVFSAIRADRIVMGVFSVRPKFIADDGKIGEAGGRILKQIHSWSDDEECRSFDITCDQSNVIVLNDRIDTYTVGSAVEQGSSEKMTKLIHVLEKYVMANRFVFLFPDIYNEFQLSLVHKAARLAFHDVRSFPKSIGIAFYYMDSGKYGKEFRDEDFLLVMDVVDMELCLTLVQGIADDRVAKSIPDFDGIIWERHPSVSYPLTNVIEEGVLEILSKMGCDRPDELYYQLGMGGLESEVGKLAVITSGGWSFPISDRIIKTIEKNEIDVSNLVDDFLDDHREIVSDRAIHVLSISRLLSYEGEASFDRIEPDSALRGYILYEKLQKRSDVILWRDHLPELSIKLLYGKFDLVNNETITPEINVEKAVRIDRFFTLPKNISEYHFDLVQNEANRRVRYAAVIKNPAFPLDHDVQCKLDMTYRYGAEEPYRLLFIPKDKDDAGFSEAKVSWERVSTYPYALLPWPEPVPCISWEDLKCYQESYIKNVIKRIIEIYRLITRGYKCYDFSGYTPKIYGKPGMRFFVADVDLDGKDVSIIMNERNRQKNKQKDGKETPMVDFSQLGEVSFELDELSLNNERVSCDLSVGSGGRQIWIGNVFGYACYRTLDIDGKSVRVDFYAGSFVDPTRFHTGIKKISFRVEHNKKNDRYIARDIMDEDNADRIYYIAKNVRVGDCPCRQVYGGQFDFLLHTMMTGRESQLESEAPMELKEAFEKAIDPWIMLYNQTEDEQIRRNMFRQMSIVACDIGDWYYDIAIEKVEACLSSKKNNYVESNIGYALGGLDNGNELALWEVIQSLPDDRIIPILAKAVWANPRFVFSVDTDVMLDFFDFAIDMLEEMYKPDQSIANSKSKKKNRERSIISCIEVLLGCFRLREGGNEEVLMHLSLNNERVRTLYMIIEDLITLMQDGKIELHSFLRLEIRNNEELNEEYRDIPLILYAMLVYITGDSGACDIRISGYESEEEI